MVSGLRIAGLTSVLFVGLSALGVQFAAAETIPECAGRTATHWGTEADNEIRGTEGNDVIAGLGGDDVIVGLGGNDIICGGQGADTIDGGPGRDRIWGDAGADELHGSGGVDRLYGRGGTTRCSAVADGTGSEVVEAMISLLEAGAMTGSLALTGSTRLEAERVLTHLSAQRPASILETTRCALHSPSMRHDACFPS